MLLGAINTQHAAMVRHGGGFERLVDFLVRACHSEERVRQVSHHSHTSLALFAVPPQRLNASTASPEPPRSCFCGWVQREHRAEARIAGWDQKLAQQARELAGAAALEHEHSPRVEGSSPYDRSNAETLARRSPGEYLAANGAVGRRAV
eukprot:SAG11_NODE_5828_length_1454_cov_2.002214_3_plen_148_part_01